MLVSVFFFTYVYNYTYVKNEYNTTAINECICQGAKYLHWVTLLNEVKLFIYFLMQVNVVSVLTKHWKKKTVDRKKKLFL